MWLSIVWSIFVLIFLALGCFYWKVSGKNISHLKLEQLLPKGVEVKVVIGGINYHELVNNFNEYIDYYNKTSTMQSRTQAIGYWVASLVALVSLIVSVVS